MTTLSQLLAAHLERAQIRRLSPRTLRTTGYQVRSFLRWLEKESGITQAERLQVAHLETWQRHLARQHTSSGLPLKPRTTNKNIQSVRTFLQGLVEQGLLPGAVLAPLVSVKEPRLLPTSVLHHAEVQRVLSGIDTLTPEGARDRALLELLYSAGLRAAEILGLGVADVDWASATALVTGKGAKQRVVPVGQTALGHLERYVKSVRPFLLRTAAQPALFLDRRGQRMPYHTFRRVVQRHAQRLNSPVTVTPHTFRRSCTTELIRGGANLYHVKELLGHESLETLKHYTRLTIEDLKETHARCHPREKG
jgi:integrase/recombinase XerD